MHVLLQLTKIDYDNENALSMLTSFICVNLTTKQLLRDVLLLQHNLS